MVISLLAVCSNKKISFGWECLKMERLFWGGGGRFLTVDHGQGHAGPPLLHEKEDVSSLIDCLR